MSKPLIQIDDLVREMTDEEYEIYQAKQVEIMAQKAEKDARSAARISALEKLSELGLTQEEIEAL